MGVQMGNTRLRTVRRAATVVLVAVAVVLLVAQDISANGRQILWYADKMDPPDRDKPVTLGDGTTFALSGGWSCVVGHASRKLRAAEERTTTCRKGNESFEFSVQCDKFRARDHVQIRFRNETGLILDFIEVGCRVRYP
jgi:hypothetical protein